MNTSVCLLGCSIGDFGAIISFAIWAPHTPIMVQMPVAMASGITTSIILETLIMRLREKASWRSALHTALGMSLISMIMMELAMNITDLYITRGGGRMAGVDEPLFWLAFLPALGAGFLAAWPYNYWRLEALNKSCCG